MKRTYLKFYISIIVLLHVFILIIYSIHIDNKNNSLVNNNQIISNNGIEIKIFNTNSFIGWGYDIYIEGNKYIHQVTIPCIQGKTGFKSEVDARKTAELVTGKINNNISPPTITLGELDSLGIIR